MPDWGWRRLVPRGPRGLRVRGLGVRGLGVRGLGVRGLRVRGLRVRGLRVRGFRAPRPADDGSWAWLEPYPSPLAESGPPSMSLAFIAALQRLPPRERAALVLNDVLGFGVAEIAQMLDCEHAAASRLLSSARTAVPGRLPGQAADEDAVVSRFTAAFERGDVAGITALLTRDAWLRMRPLPLAFRGRKAARHFLAVLAFPGGTPGYRLVATRANGQPAFGCYLRDAAAGIGRPCGLVVLTVDAGRIAAIDRFVDNSLLPKFGLPRILHEDPPGGGGPSAAR